MLFTRKKFVCPNCKNVISISILKKNVCDQCGVELEVDRVTNVLSIASTSLFVMACYILLKHYTTGVKSFSEIPQEFWIYSGLLFALYGIFALIYLPFRMSFQVKKKNKSEKR